MKYIYSILVMILLLFVSTACEDDYRDITFFTGEEPIYQIGTCDNLIGSVNLYMTHPEGFIVGIDGGDGEYFIVNGNNAVASAAFVKSENGYQRLLITPAAVGKVVITVKDGSGLSGFLEVTVDERFKTTFTKVEEGIVVTGDVTEELEQSIVKAFSDKGFTVKTGGYYELLPDDEDNRWKQGELRVYAEQDAEKPIVGRYETTIETMLGQEDKTLHFTYGDEEHLYRLGSAPESSRMSVLGAVHLWEDVTESCPVEIPEDSKVYHVELVVLKY